MTAKKTAAEKALKKAVEKTAAETTKKKAGTATPKPPADKWLHEGEPDPEMAERIGVDPDRVHKVEQDPTAELVLQPALPGLELPDHFGRAAVTQTTKLNGSGARFLGQHETGTRVIFLVEARTRSAGPFTEAADGALDYSETHTIRDLFEIPGAAGPRLLSSLRQAYRTDDTGDAREPHEDAERFTDEAGTLLTAKEIAALRADPFSALVDHRIRPVVILYSDGARELWPEEFDANAPRPQAGDYFAAEDGGRVYVEKLIDAVTGEDLEAWSDADEAGRLKDREASLEAEENGDS